MNKKNLRIFIIMLLILSILTTTWTINAKVTDSLNAPATLDNDWWSMYRHDSIHTGLSSSSAPETDNILWAYQTGDSITSSAAVVGGKVYVGSWDRNIYCFDMMNGDVLWEYTTSGKITSSPAVFEGLVYIGSQDRNVYCLDANNGNLVWNYSTGFLVESSPIVVDNKVYVGSNDGKLYCLNAINGERIWNYSTGNVIWSSPAVDDGKVFFGSLGGIFYCLDSSNGDFIWSYNTESGIWTSPTVVDGNVFFGSNDNNVYCLNADDGDFIWSYTTGGEIHSSPALAYGYVYIGCSDERLYCLDKETGEKIWSFHSNGDLWTPPSVADDKVYFAKVPCCGFPGYFSCVDAFTGERIWKYNIGELGAKSSPSIAAGKVFIGLEDGKFITFGENELIADANGPYSGYLNTPVHFTGSVYGGIPPYSWYWDFGDGNTSDKQNPIHSYANNGNYSVYLKVTDDENSESTDVTQVLIEIPNMPPNKPKIAGPINGKIGIEYEYSITGSDPDGDELYAIIDWGDNTSTGWLGPYYESFEITVKHAWEKQGKYNIRAKTKDEFDAESEWATLEVTMPKNKPFNFNFNPLSWLFEQFPHAFPIIRQLIGFD